MGSFASAVTFVQSLSQFEAQTYELAAPDGPPTYFGYVGYERNGRLFSPAVTVKDLPGVIVLSTQSVSTVSRSKVCKQRRIRARTFLSAKTRRLNYAVPRRIRYSEPTYRMT